MNEFLNQVWLDNTLRSYLIVLLIILFVIIVKRYIAQSVAALIFQFVKAVWKDVDRKTFTSLVAKPLGLFLVLLVSITTLYNLRFPEILNGNIYRVTVKEFIYSIGSLILIVSFIRLLLRMIDFISIILHIRAARSDDHSDNQLIVFFKDFFKVVISLIGIIMVLKLGFGFSVSSFITGLSIATAAIALATRESLENLIASFIIFFDKPFSVGDLVHVQQITGTVEKIGLRSTRIRTDQKTFVTVPNKQMVDSILDNLSLRTQRKAEIRLEVGLSISSKDLQQFIEAIKTKLNHPQIEDSSVFLNEIRNNSFLINADFFTAPISIREFNKLKQDKNLEILKLMEEMKIELAGASSDIKISGKLDGEFNQGSLSTHSEKI